MPVFEPEGRPRAKAMCCASLRWPDLAPLARKGWIASIAARWPPILPRSGNVGQPGIGRDLAAHRATRPPRRMCEPAMARCTTAAPPTQGIASLLILALADRLEQADGQFRPSTAGRGDQAGLPVARRHCGDPAYMEAIRRFADDAAALDMAARIDPARAPWPPQPAQWATPAGSARPTATGRVVSCIQSTYFDSARASSCRAPGLPGRTGGFVPSGAKWLECAEAGAQAVPHAQPRAGLFEDGRVMAYGTMGGEGSPRRRPLFSRYARTAVIFRRRFPPALAAGPHMGRGQHHAQDRGRV
jgi:gamma-glutamyltranspeptidase/glutathione hydrolase